MKFDTEYMSIVGYYSEIPTVTAGSFSMTLGYWHTLGKADSDEDTSWRETLKRCDPDFLKLIEAAQAELEKFNLIVLHTDIEDDLVLDMEGKGEDLEDEVGGSYISGFISIHSPYEESEDDSIPELESDWSNAPKLKAIVEYVKKNYHLVDELFEKKT